MVGRWLVAAALAGLGMGCAKSADPAPPAAEADVRAAVAALQAAVKAHDAARVWDLFDARARTDADQAAAAVQGQYRQADAAGRAELEQAYGLPGAELAALAGPGFIKARPFWKKYDELPESTITKVSVLGKQATVNYTEPDGDTEKFTLLLRDGRWKAVLAMPKAGP